MRKKRINESVVNGKPEGFSRSSGNQVKQGEKEKEEKRKEK